MAENITLAPVSSFANDSSAVATVNANNQLIENAFLDVLSRTGGSPNAMGSVLDMNSFNIINLPSPATINSPARLVDVMANPTIQVPPVGTSGATVPLLNGINTWSGAQTFNAALTITASITSSNTNTWSGQNGFTGQTVMVGAQTGNLALTTFGVVMGTTTDWLFPTYTDPFGPYAWIVGPSGTGALVLGNRSSDYSQTQNLTADLITQQVYAIHDNTTNGGGSHPYFGIWGNYWNIYRTATSYAPPTVLGLEASFVNNGAAVQGNPFLIVQNGHNSLIRLDSGVGSAGPNPVTNAIEITNDGSTFYTGICIGTNALVPSTSGFYEAIQLSSSPTGGAGPGHAIMWYSASNILSGFIYVDNIQVMHLNGLNGITATVPLITWSSTTPGFGNMAYGMSSTVGFGIWFGTGSPVTNLISGAKGSIYLENGSGQLWLNTGGGTSWTQVTVP